MFLLSSSSSSSLLLYSSPYFVTIINTTINIINYNINNYSNNNRNNNNNNNKLVTIMVVIIVINNNTRSHSLHTGLITMAFTKAAVSFVINRCSALLTFSLVCRCCCFCCCCCLYRCNMLRQTRCASSQSFSICGCVSASAITTWKGCCRTMRKGADHHTGGPTRKCESEKMFVRVRSACGRVRMYARAYVK